eukprot:m.31784 g.31784  ORF g.31784 m.31784 type:complete len:1487 (+) comp14842_c0_seq1:33-4493(+)
MSDEDDRRAVPPMQPTSEENENEPVPEDLPEAQPVFEESTTIEQTVTKETVVVQTAVIQTTETSVEQDGDEVSEEVIALFKRIDKNQSGFIEKGELGEFLKEVRLDDIDLEALFARMDVNNNERVSLEEFARLAGVLLQSLSIGEDPMPENEDEEEITDVDMAQRLKMASHMFDKVDSDRSGEIDEEEVSLLLKNLGLKNPGERLRQAKFLMQRIDISGDGNITRAEFLQAVRDGRVPGELFDDIEEEEPQKDLIDRALERFDRIDEDGSGSLDEGELELVLKGLGMTDPRERKERTTALMAVIDDDDNGFVTRVEFLQAVSAGHLSDLFGEDDEAGLLIDDEEETTSQRFGDQSDDEDMGIMPIGKRSDFEDIEAERLEQAMKQFGLTEAKVQELWTLFHNADIDGGGTIGLAELRSILEDPTVTGVQGRRITGRHVKAVMDAIDENGDQELDFEEFVEAFDSLVDGDGSKMSGPLAKAEIDALVAELDEKDKLIASLTQERDEAKKSLKFKTAESADLLAHSQDTAQMQLDKLQDDVSVLQRRNKYLEQQIKELTAVKKATEQTFEKNGSPSNRKDTGGAYSFNMPRVDEADYRAVNQQLRTLANEKEMLESRFASEQVKAEETIKDLNRQLQEALDSISQLQTQIDVVDYERTSTLERYNTELLEEVEELRRRVQDGDKRIEQDKKQVEEIADDDAVAWKEAYYRVLRDFEAFKGQTLEKWKEHKEAAAEQQKATERRMHQNMAEAKQEQEALQAQLDAARNDLNALRAKLGDNSLDELSDDLSALQRKADMNKAKEEQLASEFGSAVDRMKKENESLTRQLADKEAAWEQERSSMEAALKAAEDGLEEAVHKRQVAQQEVDKVRIAKDEEIDTLQLRVAELELKGANSDVKMVLEGFEGTPEEIARKLKELLAHRNEEYNALENLRQSQANDINALQTKIKEKEDQMAAKDGQVRDLEAKVNNMRDELIKHGIKVDDSADAFNPYAELEKANAQIAGLRTELEAATWKKHEMKTNLEKLQAKYEMDSDISKLNVVVRQLRDRENELKLKDNMIALKDKEIAEKDNIIDYKSKQLEDRDREHSHTDKELQAKRQQFEMSASQIAEHQQLVENLKASEKSLKERVNELETELRTTVELKGTLEQDLESLRSRYQQLQTASKDKLLIQGQMQGDSGAQEVSNTANEDEQLEKMLKLQSENIRLKSAKQEADRLRIQIRQLESEIKIFRESPGKEVTKTVYKDNPETVKQLRELRTQLEVLTLQKETYERRLKTINTTVAVENPDTLAELETLKTELVRAKAEKDRLQRENDALRSGSEAPTVVSPSLDSPDTLEELRKLRARLAGYQTKETEYENQIALLRRGSSMSQVEVEASRAALEVAKRREEEAKNNIQRLLSQQSRLEQDLEKANRKINQLKIENAQLRGRAHTSTGSGRSRQILADLSSLRSETQRLNQERGALDEDIANLSSATESHEREVRHLQEEK